MRPYMGFRPMGSPDDIAAMFAFVWGVNPEALLFLETDGTTFSFAWARLGAAQSQAKLDDRMVWEAPPATEHEHPTAGYTSIHRNASIPLELEAVDDESK